MKVVFLSKKIKLKYLNFFIEKEQNIELINLSNVKNKSKKPIGRILISIATRFCTFGYNI